MLDSLKSISVFVAIAQCGSLTAAAKHLGMTPSGVSKGLQRLEEAMGVELVKRTTRSVKLTPDGLAYANRCREILDELEAASDIVSHRRAEVSGTIRLQVPAAFGRHAIIPLLAGFLDSHPRLILELQLAGRPFGADTQSVDLALRLGLPEGNGLIARKIADIPFALCASPRYLHAFGEPEALEDLHEHRCLVYVDPDSGRKADWEFDVVGHPVTLSPRMAISANGTQALIDFASAGLGIVYGERPAMASAIASGALTPILRRYPPASKPLYALYSPTRHMPKRVRLLLDHFIETIPRHMAAFIDAHA